MLAYMNKTSLTKTLETGETWFWSRSRGELWHKGATSGHTQQVKEIRYDCDGDALLIEVIQKGAACHTGEKSCFYNDLYTTEKNEGRAQILQDLYGIIEDRKANPKEGSYTNYLFDKGMDKILKKVGEETAEVIIAAKNPAKEELIYETSDLLYHLLVLLKEKEVPLEDIFQELQSRHG
ncbi:phosphoribosyl-ATP pyrophosphatase /phosphoribosyl-AMP cyclohydrolase [Natronincola ferrireducens]|uniref:Histidine biosynthesis bifunctional protein HisIE n=2 Tax=Natronincola ferrireducens TaxID=393762 RepID=A0A1G8X6X7_9FIRM|nr:phosphoribosyl-ATP pyrophosphatase /phosphoribosyl-AMP cyclohydrolase [Natronincola ferrireducens]